MQDPDPRQPRISPDQVQHVAKLARLALAEPAAQRLAAELESILEYVTKINEVDVKGVEPMAHVLPLRNVLREDRVGEMLPVEEALKNAPDRDGPFFKVPKVIGGDEDSAG